MTQVIEPPLTDATPTRVRTEVTRRRPFFRTVLQWIRRVHLYLGLFLFPWAVLYGVTGFLFNHPLVLSDQPSESFGREAWTGTAMAETPDELATARLVVQALKQRHGDAASDLRLIEAQPVRYVREFAFATVKTETADIGLALDVLGAGGTIRRTPISTPAKPEEAFPWSVGKSAPPRGARGPGAPGGGKPMEGGDRLTLDDSLADRLKASIPELLQARQLPVGEVTLTSVPDLTFVVESAGRLWKSSYNSQSGTVGGKPWDAPVEPLSWRRFLLRLHLAHGYPLSSTGARWFWAVGVDVMAFVMVYWGGSGLLMWWQIKTTRKLGACLLILSAVAATALAVGMHSLLSVG